MLLAEGERDWKALRGPASRFYSGLRTLFVLARHTGMVVRADWNASCKDSDVAD